MKVKWLILGFGCISLILSCSNKDPNQILVSGEIIAPERESISTNGLDMILVKSSNKSILAVTVSDFNGRFMFTRHALINVAKQGKYDLICTGYNGSDSLTVMQDIDGGKILDPDKLMDFKVELTIGSDNRSRD